VKKVVGAEYVQAALRAINAALGKGVPAEEMEKWRTSGSSLPELSGKPVITNLFNCSSAIHLVSSLFGQTCKQARGGQIALRFPGSLCNDNFEPVTWWNRGWHIDGFHSKNNGLAPDTISNFNCLVGVVLADVPGPFHGNLGVFPRSHYVLQDYFLKHGFDKVKKEGLEALPTLPLSNCHQVTAEAGDIVLAHYSLAHTICPNTSSLIRYAIYFRTSAPSFYDEDFSPLDRPGTNDPHRPASMLDIWRDFQGLTEEVKAFSLDRVRADEKDGSAMMSPMYAEQYKKDQDMKLMMQDQERLDLESKMNVMWEAGKWKEVAPLLVELCRQRPDDYWLHFKAGGAMTWPHWDAQDRKTLSAGEWHIRRAIHLAPSTPNGHTLLSQNLHNQRRHAEAVEAVRQMLACPVADERGQTVVHGLESAQRAAVQLDQTELMISLCETARNKYPQLRYDIDELSEKTAYLLLKRHSDEWLSLPNARKDWVRGELVHKQWVDVYADDYRANLMMGSVLTWQPRQENLPRGEVYLRKAIALSPTQPAPYSVLATNLLHRRKTDQAVTVVSEMLSALRQLPERDAKAAQELCIGGDAFNKFVEALRTAAKILGGKSKKFVAMLHSAEQVAPSIKHQLAAIKW